MEIITGVERRRRWRVADKLRILAELDEPGVKFNDVARRHDLSRGLLWQWRDAHRCGQLVEEPPVFLPVRVAMDQPRPACPSVPAPGARPFRRKRTRSGRIEFKLMIAKMRHERFGASSERGRKLLDQLDLQLKEMEAAATEDEAAVQANPSACPCCQGKLSKLGEDVTETLEVIPRHFKAYCLA